MPSYCWSLGLATKRHLSVLILSEWLRFDSPRTADIKKNTGIEMNKIPVVGMMTLNNINKGP